MRRCSAAAGGFTLVEMLVAMAITLVMMAAVVTIFANVGRSVQHRRALVEVESQLRHVRNVLQRDLAHATSPALTWQRPEANRGYIEIIEGPYSDQNPSMYTDGKDDTDDDGRADELVPEESFVPRGAVPDNLLTAAQQTPDGGGELTLEVDAPAGGSGPRLISINGLGDHDDILALTIRDEVEPFVGRVPDNVRTNQNTARAFNAWPEPQVIQAPLAEVIWFCVENPMDDTGGFMGEAGFRTIYRRVLLIAPWLAPYRFVDPDTGVVYDAYTQTDIGGGSTIDNGASIRTRPGIVRVLPEDTTLDEAFAGLIAFQERYDLSVRLEYDPTLDPDDGGRFVIVANTLGDLTKRENRYEHFGFKFDGPDSRRVFPYTMAAGGSRYSDTDVTFVPDPELTGPDSAAQASAILDPNHSEDSVMSYQVNNQGSSYNSRPFAFVADDDDEVVPATARAVLNDDQQVVYVTRGLVPLSGARRGEDVMLSDVLGFDVRVYDPGAPLYPEIANPTDPDYPGTVLDPADPGWPYVALEDSDSGNDPNPVGYGAYVDLGYWSGYVDLFLRRGYWNNIDDVDVPGPLNTSVAISQAYGLPGSPFAYAPLLKSQLGAVTTAGYLVDGFRVYDTWSFHYENNGLNEDGDEMETLNLNPPPATLIGPMIDEGTNGLDDLDPTFAGDPNLAELASDIAILGPDDIRERETSPPYDVPLRGVQIKIRVYERDSRQMREVSVQQHFVPE